MWSIGMESVAGGCIGSRAGRRQVVKRVTRKDDLVMQTEPAGALRFAVLGPLRGWRDDTEVELGSPQQHAALAALLLREGHPATVSQLVDAVWGMNPPRTAVQTLRTYISRLRRAFRANAGGHAIPGRLESAGEGYRLRLQQNALDLAVFQSRVTAAETERAAGNLRAAASHLEAALQLWQGVPLAGLPGPFAEQQRDRLEEMRLAALATKLEIDLELGCHAHAAAELTALTSEYPLHERFRELSMLALYRSGRQADALDLYHDTRRVLTTKLGIEPGPALKTLQQRILAADPDLSWHAARSTTPVSSHLPATAPEDLERANDLGTDLGPPPRVDTTPVRPAQLPADITSFVGRPDELTSSLLSDTDGRYAPVVISGMAGVGKTTLAVHWAGT